MAARAGRGGVIYLAPIVSAQIATTPEKAEESLDNKTETTPEQAEKITEKPESTKTK